MASPSITRKEAIRDVREAGAGLWKMPLSGGEESQVLPSVVAWDAFSLVKEGIYFIPGPPNTKSSIQFLSFVTGKVKTVSPMSARTLGAFLFRRTAGPSCSRRSTT